jgi:hypothetical protein
VNGATVGRLAAFGGVALAGFAGGLLVGRRKRMPLLRRDEHWSIGIYRGPSPLHLAPPPGLVNPVLTRRDVADVPARGLADPFMIQRDGRWWLFCEVLNRRSGRGEIGLASSDDGLHWRYQRIVLAEPFHLSYPFVFEWQEQVYLLPECNASHAIRLYRADPFPDRWTEVGVLLYGPFRDSTIVSFADRLWMFTADRADVLRLFQAPDLLGPWQEHPASPIVYANPRIARPAGRALVLDGRVHRFAQSGVPYYGSELHAFALDELTATTYREHPLEPSPLLRGSGHGWNARGMHHLDAHQLGPTDWLACVDGFHLELAWTL